MYGLDSEIHLYISKPSPYLQVDWPIKTSVYMKGSEFKLEVDERTLASRKVTQFLKIKKLQKESQGIYTGKLSEKISKWKSVRIKFEPVTFLKFF